MGEIGLRPAGPADETLCLRLHRAAMREYVEAVWGWDEAEQRAYHQRGYDPAATMIVTVGGADAGVLIVHRGEREIYLGRIELHPDHQGRGIGTELVGRLLAEAAGRGQPLLLDVLAVNPRARALYERLGFRAVESDDRRTRMRADPSVHRPAVVDPGAGPPPEQP